MWVSQWLTCCLDLQSFDRVLPGSWRSRKGRVDGEGQGGGKERVGQINNGILSGLGSLPLSFSLSVSVSVSCSGPLLLSQANFIAGPWTWAKQANSMPVSLLVSAHALWLTARKYATSRKSRPRYRIQLFAARCVYFSLIFISLSLSCLILSQALLFHQLAFLNFPFCIQPQTTGICEVWWVKIPIGLEGLDGLYVHIQLLFKSSGCPVSCPTDPLIALQPRCAVSSCPSTSPPAPSIVRRGWTWDCIETVLAAEPDRNWRGIPQTINFSMHAFLLINAL